MVRLDTERATTSADLRAHNLARLLRAVHDGGGMRTRAELTRQLSLARGTATVLVRDLADRNLIEELQLRADEAVHRSRGRPTGVPSAHPDGPVALAVDLRDDSFSIASFELTGRGKMVERRERQSASGADLLDHLAQRLAAHRGRLAPRLVGIGVAVPSPLSHGRMVQPGLASWHEVDVARELATGPVPVLVGNDARLAGLAEARRGGLRDVSVALHLHVATGIGGVLLSGGEPLTGAHGAAGEFGHLPLTGGTELCRCGCVGCWELDAGSHGLLHRAGLPKRATGWSWRWTSSATPAGIPSVLRRWPMWPRRWAAAWARWSTPTTRRRSACPGWAGTFTRPPPKPSWPGTPRP